MTVLYDKMMKLANKRVNLMKSHTLILLFEQLCDGLATWHLGESGRKLPTRSLFFRNEVELWWTKRQHVTAQWLRIFQGFCPIFCPLTCDVVQHSSSFDLNWAEWYAFSIFEVWIDSNEITMWSQNSEAKHHNLNPTCYHNKIKICHFPAVTSSWTSKVLAEKEGFDVLQDLGGSGFWFFGHEKLCFFYPFEFQPWCKKRHVMFFQTWLLKESDGLVDSDCDSDVIDVWGKSWKVQVFDLGCRSYVDFNKDISFLLNCT